MEIKNTPLEKEHIRLNAQMATFAGWKMPIHYGGILEEVRNTRRDVSIFDISHMGELIIKEDPDNSSLDGIVTVPVTKMKKNTCKYGFFLNEEGTIADDLIVYRIKDDEWMLVVNAVNERKDAEILKDRLSRNAYFENKSDEIVKLDIQGPKSLDIMKEIVGDEIIKLKYYNFDFFPLLGGEYSISRTGYTGELGFEVYIDKAKGAELWQLLLKQNHVKAAGLGARDLLRLEMGYPLYGHELNEEITPYEANLNRFLDMGKDFTGKKNLIKLMEEEGTPRRKKLVGFVVHGRRTPRHHNRIMVGDRHRGYVTSGAFSPHLNKGIGMGYVERDSGYEGREIFIDSGKAFIKARIEKMPFIKETSIRSSPKELVES